MSKKKSEKSLSESDDATNNRSNFVFATPKKSSKLSKSVDKSKLADEATPTPKKSMKRNEQSQDEDEEVLENPKKKNRTKSPHPMVVIPKQEAAEESSTSIDTPSKKKKRKKDKDSELSSGTQQSETDTDIPSSSTSTSKPKKKKKKKSMDDESVSDVKPPSKKPPSSLVKYYAENVYQGKPSRMESSFSKLSKKERKQLNADYNEKVECYVTQLKTYLQSLPKEEAMKYVSSHKLHIERSNFYLFQSYLDR